MSREDLSDSFEEHDKLGRDNPINGWMLKDIGYWKQVGKYYLCWTWGVMTKVLDKDAKKSIKRPWIMIKFEEYSNIKQ